MLLGAWPEETLGCRNGQRLTRIVEIVGINPSVLLVNSVQVMNTQNFHCALIIVGYKLGS